MELERLGKYEIVAKIGEGGMGEVYRAHDAVLGRDVAIKTMVTKLVGDSDEARQRFHREARSAAQLNHPNIITIHDFGEEQGRMYIAMELLEGGELKEVVSGRVALDLPAKLGVMEQICDGLAFAHAKGIVHRDLKPGNIHVQRNGQVKIMDFGVARIAASEMTRTGSLLGTPQYMSPEQIQGKKATARSDVFSLGCVFYELVSGRKSFESDSVAGVMFQIMQGEPPPLEQLRPDLPPQLHKVIRRALAKDPAQRYADAGELREALREVRAALALATTLAPASTLGRSTVVEPPTVAMAPATRGAAARQLAPEPTDALTRAAIPETLAGGAPTQVAEARPGPPQAPRPLVPSRRAPLPWIPVAAAGLVLGTVTAGVLALRLARPVAAPHPSPPPASAAPAQAPATTPPPPPELEAARSSLTAKDYRAARVQAERVLALDAGNEEARSLRDQAAGALRQADSVLASLRRSLSTGDGRGAAQALSRLTSEDPLNPELPVLRERLEELLRVQAEALRRREEEQRRAVVVPATLPPATTLPAATPPPPPTTQPATTPPPPTAPPITSPTQSEAAARQAIRGVLDEYRAAFERRDADALRAVQPGVDYSAMKQTFATVTGYTVRIAVEEVTVQGDTGLARCTVTYNPVPKPADKIKPVTTVFHLRRTGDVWRIERLERK